MINTNATSQISSAAVPQQQSVMNNSIPGLMPGGGVSAMQYNQTGGADLLRQTAMRDMNIISNLVKSGIINPVQGQHLMNYILNKAQEVIGRQAQTPSVRSQNNSGIVSGIEAFLRENPEFFNQNGRRKVLEYLANSNTVVDKDEIMQISQMIEALEQSAVESYLQKQAHEKSINDENKAAKEKLRANAQNSNAADANARVFTREQIGRMSGAEFARNEKAIMEQLKNGLIR